MDPRGHRLAHFRGTKPWGDTACGHSRRGITPVLDGAALVEEWAGPFASGFMIGFSLRAYDPAADLWTILLFWTTDGNASFGRKIARTRRTVA